MKFVLLPLFYIYMFCLVIFLYMFTNNTPLKLVHSFASDPSGGGVLQLSKTYTTALVLYSVFNLSLADIARNAYANTEWFFG